MTMRKNKPQPNRGFILLQSFVSSTRGIGGIWALLLSLLLISLIAGLNFQSPPKIFMEGEIADIDVISNKDMQIADEQKTAEKKKSLQYSQPAVYDFSIEPLTRFQNKINELFSNLKNPSDFSSNSSIKSLKEEFGDETAENLISVIQKPKIQAFVINKLIPLISNQVSEGMVSDARNAKLGNGGIYIHNLETNDDILKSELRTVPDAQSFLGRITAYMERSRELDPEEISAIHTLMSAWFPVTLTYNQEATRLRTASVLENVHPVFYPVSKGEMLIRKGERVSREQQLILQTLDKFSANILNWNLFSGTFLFSLVFSCGFFLSPGGKKGTPLHTKDVYLISVVLLFFGLLAKGAYIFGVRMDSPYLHTALAVAFPVAGASGLVSMVFSAKRYCTITLLLSFFTVIIFNQGLPIFIYYFLGGLLATWLVIKAQSRQDVLWNIIPLTIGLLIIGSAFLCLETVPYIDWLYQYIAIIVASLLSLIILFAFSPVLESIFGYSTRFRLMELMSLEQPLMQEIMVTIPGTYHHSLVVANMVEAGAKAIGANSLLCKVAALYHDAGKLSYPDYFIENQFGAPNKHDRLAPSMSALILLSHVKKGAELAEKYKLGKEIADIIKQHHGTRMMKFFYQKAINMGEKPQESEYSYPGPKPQTKEAAILMLADSVEASSRTLTDPTPARIKSHIDKIIKGIFAEGQLDESELTFKDLNYLSENFQRILTGLFHQRIVYPESKIDTQKNNISSKNENESTGSEK